MVTKAIPVTGREGPYGCEKSRFPHFLDNRLTDGGKVVSPTRPMVTKAGYKLIGYPVALRRSYRLVRLPNTTNQAGCGRK
jgi:hypothetical protein